MVSQLIAFQHAARPPAAVATGLGKPARMGSVEDFVEGHWATSPHGGDEGDLLEELRRKLQV